MSSYRNRQSSVRSARGIRFGIVASRYNSGITQRLLEGARRILKQAKASRIDEVFVPGAFEIPLALDRLAGSRRYDGLIALGAVIRGETPHFDYVAGEAARGVMEVMLSRKIPIAFGILTTNTERQAKDRAGGRLGNKGEEAARTVIEMVYLPRRRQ